ncbi:Nn.00g024440.m01.CDS01 [Neocucurbitaria sp. VM-36]
MSASVQINGDELEVTENLYMALRQLRSHKTDRILWVDAICIDQGNHRERGHQVQQMGRIYSQAEQVILWLGSGTEDTDVLMDSLKRLEEESHKFPCKNWKLADERWASLWSSLQLILKNQHWGLASRQCAGLELLLSRPWFRRVWILQEVANARRAIVCSGEKSVSARIFALAPSLMHAYPEPHCQAVLDIMPGPSRNDSWWNYKRDLYTLLLKFNESKASDPRDMIYALLGLCLDTDDATYLPADYTKTPQQVVANAASYLFSLSDCPYRTIPELIRDADLLNTHTLIKLVEWEDASDVAEFLGRRGSEVTITEEVVEAAARNLRKGDEVMQALFEHRGSEIKITEKIVKAAVRNTVNGRAVINFILQKRRSEVEVSKELVEATAENSGCGKVIISDLIRRECYSCVEEIGPKLAELFDDEIVAPFIRRHRSKLNRIGVGEEMMEAAARNPCWGKEIMELLLLPPNTWFRVTEKVLRGALRNTGSGKQVMRLLFARRGEEVVIAAILSGMGVIGQLFEEHGKDIKITEQVMMAAAGCTRDGGTVINFLLKQCGKKIEVAVQVVAAAASNRWSGKEVINLLLRERGSEVKITWEVATAAAGNSWCGKELLDLLYEKRGKEVVMAVVTSGAVATGLLIDQRGSEDKVIEEVVMAAAGNSDGGKLLRYLYEITDVKITDGVVESAATSGQEDTLQLLEGWAGAGIVSEKWKHVAQLCAAAKEGDTKTVRQLIKKHVPLDMKDIRGTTPLWHAARERHLDVLRVLLATNAVDVNAQSIAKRTPLFWPAAGGHVEVVKLLLDHGARQDYADEYGRSPLEIAQLNNRAEVANLLINDNVKKLARSKIA